MNTIQSNPVHQITIEPTAEAKLAVWLKTRGGIAVWTNKDLSSSQIGMQTFTPALTNDDQYPGARPTVAPHWNCGTVGPDFVITEPSQITVRAWREVSRVKVRRGGPWTGGVHRADRPRLDRALSDAGDGASFHFDYSREYGSAWFTAVVSVPDAVRPFDPTV